MVMRCQDNDSSICCEFLKQIERTGKLPVSIPVIGSSSRTTFFQLISACTIAGDTPCPPESVPASLCQRDSEPHVV
eukprot:scaffold32086_cov183-Amphora_coffeaeformis.AAC.3